MPRPAPGQASSYALVFVVPLTGVVPLGIRPSVFDAIRSVFGNLATTSVVMRILDLRAGALVPLPGLVRLGHQTASPCRAAY